ncbi:MAG: FtsW/RodA/SpoVE family cell cycle protein [Lentisphaeria bacterium]|nr:FtsW/RodA/SpoVE family cell cycle protein [Lentisphaeria bacterium]
MGSELPARLENGQRRSEFPTGAALLLAVAGLLGCLAIYNAQVFTADPGEYVMRQMLWLGAGTLLFLVSASVPFRYYRKAALPLLVVCLTGLAAVLFTGVSVNGMRGWLPLGNFKFQPSELAKTGFLLYLCVRCGPRREMSAGEWFKLFPLLLLTARLVMAEPDFGSAVMFFVIFLLVSVVSGTKLPYLLLGLGSLAAAGLFFVLTREYAMGRIIGFLNTGATGANTWHIRQFEYTMAHGGWLGADWGNALWSGTFLPLAPTDSVFASIVESTGCLGGLLVIGGFLLMGGAFCVLSWRVRGDNNDRRYFIFCAGASCLVQALIHISVNCVLIPPTGITLPILSYGGSSLSAVMLTFGIAFSAARADEPETVRSLPHTAGGEPRIDRAGSPQQ